MRIDGGGHAEDGKEESDDGSAVVLAVPLLDKELPKQQPLAAAEAGGSSIASYKANCIVERPFDGLMIVHIDRCRSCSTTASGSSGRHDANTYHSSSSSSTEAEPNGAE
jgi:hypothetical protein